MCDCNAVSLLGHGGQEALTGDVWFSLWCVCSCGAGPCGSPSGGRGRIWRRTQCVQWEGHPLWREEGPGLKACLSPPLCRCLSTTWSLGLLNSIAGTIPPASAGLRNKYVNIPTAAGVPLHMVSMNEKYLFASSLLLPSTLTPSFLPPLLLAIRILY